MIYMYKYDFALANHLVLICHLTNQVTNSHLRNSVYSCLLDNFLIIVDILYDYQYFLWWHYMLNYAQLNPFLNSDFLLNLYFACLIYSTTETFKLQAEITGEEK